MAVSDLEDRQDLLEWTPDGDIPDPGLYPGFRFYMSNVLPQYLSVAPGRINALLSGFKLLADRGLPEAIQHVRNARTLFLDSGAITPLLYGVRGKTPPVDVRTWLTGTDRLVDLAFTLVDNGSPVGVIAALDLPAYAGMLATAQMTVQEAERITLDNAQALMRRTLPPGWIPVFTSQGVTLDDHRRCMAAYQSVGVLDLVRQGRAWLAVGGMAFESSADRVWTIHEAVRDILGPGHIHGLGIGRIEVLTRLIIRDWIQSADVSSPFQSIKYNRGPYEMPGTTSRPSFLTFALHASAALSVEADLDQALKHPDRLNWSVQTAFPWE